MPRYFALRLLATVTLCLAAALPAQQPEPSPNLAGIAHIALRVHSLDASIAFYEKLGFVKAFDLSRDGKVYEAFIKINDHQFLELYPTTPKDSEVGFLHVCFYGFDLHSVHDYYAANGLKPTEVKTAGAGNLLFTMPGPASPTGPQNMEYTQYMPGSLHSKDAGQHLGPNRIAAEITRVLIATDDPAKAAAFYKDKAGFMPFGVPTPTHTLFKLPGGTSESVEIVPSAQLGHKAQITLDADPLKATAALKSTGLTIDTDHILTDPDGNRILFAR